MALHPRTVLKQRFGNKRTVEPAAEPVTLAEAKDHLRETGSESDAFITTLISEARTYLEEKTGLAFINQTWKLTLDHWPAKADPWWNGVRDGAITELSAGPAEIEIPRYPLSSITSITTYDEASNSTVLTVSDFFDVDTNSRRGRLVLKFGQVWPIAMRNYNAIEIIYVAGFGAAADAVDPLLKRAIRNMVAYMFEHRGTCGMNSAYENSGAKELIGLFTDKSV